MQPLSVKSKPVAEKLLRDLQTQGVFPKNFSGFLFPKSGNYIHIWQFHQNKLIGTVAIHTNNLDNAVSKMKEPLDLDNIIVRDVDGNSLSTDES